MRRRRRWRHTRSPPPRAPGRTRPGTSVRTSRRGATRAGRATRSRVCRRLVSSDARSLPGPRCGSRLARTQLRGGTRPALPAQVFYRILTPLYTMANLGYVGLGVMGGRMAERLMGRGHTVTGYNRTRAKAQWLIDKGLRWAETPRDVVASSDVTFTMVTDSHALEAIADGPDGLLAGIGPGKVLIDMSTVSPTTSRDLA